MKSFMLFLYARQWTKVFASFTHFVLSTTIFLFILQRRKLQLGYRSHLSKITWLGSSDNRIGIPP